MFALLKKLLQTDEKEKKLKPIHYLIVLLGIGIALMILTDFLQVEPDQPLSFATGSVQTSGAGDDPPAVPAIDRPAGMTSSPITKTCMKHN
jgi:stage III sporulation protein AG